MAEPYKTLYQTGVDASAARSGQCTPSGVVGGGASWATSPGTRSAYITEVGRRIDALWQSIYTSHKAPEDFRQQFAKFHQDWQQWVAGLSKGSMLLPSTEEHAQRVDLQVNDWIRRFQAYGGTVSVPSQSPPGPPAGPPFPWKPLIFTVALVAGVTALIYTTSTARAIGRAAA